MRRAVRTVRVDQGHSPLGNPYTVRREEEREAACDAYEELLLLGPTVAAERPWRVAEVGTMNGFFGEVRGWDGRGSPEGAGAADKNCHGTAAAIGLPLPPASVPRAHGSHDSSREVEVVMSPPL